MNQRDGECIFELFTLVPNNQFGITPQLDLPNKKRLNCCNAYSNKVFASLTNDDEYQNDVNGFLWYFDSFITSCTMYLQKYNDSLADYEDVFTLENSDLGTFYEYGFFTNSLNQRFIGYQLNWKLVLLQFGSGSYRVKLSGTSALNYTSFLYSNEFCLKEYNKYLADKTIKIEWTLNGLYGDVSNDLLRRDYGNLDWYNSMRLNGIFFEKDNTYTRESTLYENGQRVYVKQELEPEYLLQLKQININQFNTLKVDIVMPESGFYVTDYNSQNLQRYVKKLVQLDSNLTLKQAITRSDLVSVDLTCKQAINNFRRSNC